MSIERSNSQATVLTALANAWVAEGAAALSISIDGASVFAWPPRASIGRPDLAAPIRRGEELVGEIQIKGRTGLTSQARLGVDALLLGQLLKAEADLATMTDELIETQDQLLAVYDLAQLARRRVGVAETLVALSQAAARLLDVEGTAVVLAPEDRTPVITQYPEAAQDQAWLVTLFSILTLRQQSLLWQGQGLSEQLPGDLRSLLMVPIQIGGRVKGGLVFWSKEEERFASPEIKLAHAIAEHAGAQIENGLLHQERVAQAGLETEMALARGVQGNLLPKGPPALPGLGLYARTRPASHVGGDYFDFVGAADGSSAFLVGDVSGKGLSAALVMAMMRTILRSLVGRGMKTSNPGQLRGPAALLALANDELYEDLTALSMFATVFVAQYYAGSRRLVYANAGHSPVIYRPANGSARLLEADSAPIGVLRATVCRDRVAELGPGDLLVAASDGFNEARNHAEELFGIERLLACVDANGDLPAEALGPALFAAVEEHSQGQIQEDDQTLVIAKGASM